MQGQAGLLQGSKSLRVAACDSERPCGIIVKNTKTWARLRSLVPACESSLRKRVSLVVQRFCQSNLKPIVSSSFFCRRQFRRMVLRTASTFGIPADLSAPFRLPCFRLLCPGWISSAFLTCSALLGGFPPICLLVSSFCQRYTGNSNFCAQLGKQIADWSHWSQRNLLDAAGT